nr:zinc finger, CCHC-type [Tanacetum cinerariifolium]
MCSCILKEVIEEDDNLAVSGKAISRLPKACMIDMKIPEINEKTNCAKWKLKNIKVEGLQRAESLASTTFTGAYKPWINASCSGLDMGISKHVASVFVLMEDLSLPRDALFLGIDSSTQAVIVLGDWQKSFGNWLRRNQLVGLRRIIHETTAPYTPQQNGVAEKKNRALKEMINSMLSYSGLSEGFWGETMAVVRLPVPKRKTLGEKGIDCIFVGYAEHFKAYRPKDIIPNSDESQRDDHYDDIPSEIPEPRKEKPTRVVPPIEAALVSQILSGMIIG